MAYQPEHTLPGVRPPVGKCVIPLLLGFHMLWLVWMGRSAFCACGVVSFWQTGSHAAENSQQFADPYSFLHVVFGIGLFLLFRWLRPTWRMSGLALLALFSSTVWEVVENTPWVIELMNNAANAAPNYDGDSMLNSLADTGFAMAGFWLARTLPWQASVALAVMLEALVSWMISDGLLLAAGRLLINLINLVK